MAKTKGDAPPLVGLTMRALATYQFPHRQVLLTRHGSPIVSAGYIGQIHADRGTGKTWLAHTLAIVAATGTDALGFSAPTPCRVLILDGEMAGEELKARVATLGQALNVLDTDNLTLVAADWQECILPRLDTPNGQALVAPFVDPADLIIIDNRSTLFDPEAEKDPAAWQAAQDWLLSLRRRGKAVLIVHHSNRQGGARGHSKPEDVMNVIMKLTRPENYRADQGARFTVEFTKARGAHGASVAPFTTQLTGSGWQIEDGEKESSAVAKLKSYLALAQAAGDRPRSANAAIRAAQVSRNAGLAAWAQLLEQGTIVKQVDGFQLREP